MSRIGDGLRKQRLNSGLSVGQVVLALREYGIEKSQKAVYSWESGKKMPDGDTLLALCDIYGTPEILAAFGYAQPKDEFDALQQLHDVARRLTPADQEYLLELARRLSKLK